MTNPITTLSRERLMQILHYDPGSGLFTWINDQRSGVKAGSVAGSINSNGYIIIMISKKSYSAHRLAYFYVKGVWPQKHIDHINGVRTDNRIKNLRNADSIKNGQNMRLLDTNKSGFKGVHWSKACNKWRAKIDLNGSQHHLGFFSDLELAALVAAEARDKYFGEYNRPAAPGGE